MCKREHQLCAVHDGFEYFVKVAFFRLVVSEKCKKTVIAYRFFDWHDVKVSARVPGYQSEWLAVTEMLKCSP